MTTELTDEQYEIADKIERILEGPAGKDGLPPSGVARRAKVTYDQAWTVLTWMVRHQYAHTSGNGAWTRYHAGRYGR